MSISSDFPQKLFCAALLSRLEPGALMEGAFCLLIFLDCFTRLTAISHQRLAARGEPAGLWDAIRGIPAARRERLIASGIMRRRSVEKLISYHLVLATAAAVDFLSGGAAPLLPLAAAYLSMTEGLSILENLSDAGVDNVAFLLARLRERLGKR